MSDDPILPDSPSTHTGMLDETRCAALLHSGLTIAQIALEANVPLDLAQEVAARPLTLHLLEKKRKRGTFDVEKALQDELEPTFERLVAMRDFAEDESLQFRAAVELFDRQRPKITRTEEERTTRFIFEAVSQVDAAKIEAEVAVIDAEFAAIDAHATKKKADLPVE